MSHRDFQDLPFGGYSDSPLPDAKPVDFVGYFQGYSGHEFDPLHPTPADIKFDDVCVGGAREGRYSNQTLRYYPVAVHEVLVSQLCEKIARERGWPEDLVLLVACEGLLHDGSESYTHDMPRGFKRHPGLKAFVAMEDELQRCVYAAFGVVPIMGTTAMVKEVDDRLIVDEVFALMPNPEAYMHRRAATRPNDVGFDIEIPDVRTWEQAAYLWAQRFDELWPDFRREGAW